MADVPDPNTAPSHLDVREAFASAHVALAATLGIVAAVAGIVLGLTLANN